VDTQTIKKKYADLRAKALAIPEHAATEDRPLTPQEQTQLASLVEQAQAKHAEIERQQRGRGLSRDELDRIIQTGVKGEGQGLGTRELHPWTKALQEATHLVGHGTKAGVLASVGNVRGPAARAASGQGERGRGGLRGRGAVDATGR
jgi:hypothetical protein